MINDEGDEVIKESFDSLKNGCQNNLESMKVSEFVIYYLYLLYCKCYKINLNRGGSYKDYPDRIEPKKTTINSINKKDNKCFQYAVTVALNHEKIGKIFKRMYCMYVFISPS